MQSALGKRKNSKSREKSIKSFDEVLVRNAWEKVKIKGRLVSDDGGGFEGLIGLEVLENYDPKLVGTFKGKATRKQKRMEKKLLKAKKQKFDAASGEEKSCCEHSDEDEYSSEHNYGDDKKANKSASTNLGTTRKERLTARTLQKIEKRNKRREKRKTKRQTQLTIHAKTKSPIINRKSAEDKQYPTDRFALLRPPPADGNNTDDRNNFEEQQFNANDNNNSHKVNKNTLDIDDLEGWNGLGVPQSILRALAENGFKSPTEIQAMTLPAAILGKKDILGAAETGSGKTLAFGIPILAGILELKSKNARTGIRKLPNIKEQVESSQRADENMEEDAREGTPPVEELELWPKPPTDDEETNTSGDNDNGEQDNVEHNKPLYAVVLTPTRELAVQVKEHLVAAAKYTGIKIAAIFGGLAVAKQERLLRQRPEIVVATPGRFWELYGQDNPHLNKVDDISFLVIDETDRMVEKGHFEELRLLLKVINADEVKKKTRQNFVFSATLTLVHDVPEHMQKKKYWQKF